ncbi:MAG: B12-binding domain-containing radical SAM protein, partial [Planctomycetota bacterium]
MLKTEVLPAIIGWMERRKRPFTLNTQVSINLCDDEELMRLMVQAGFDTVFVGIETPDEQGLAECSKSQNRNRDLVASVKKIQSFGLQVQGGFILGFDSDRPSIFPTLTKFIQESGIVTAMVGLLNAPPGTKLYKRLLKENRVVKTSTGDNTDLSMNFLPKMKYE